MNLNEYTKENAEFLNQPIIKSFFENESDNLLLLEAAFIQGNKEAKEDLDRRFVEHFFYYRLIKYISTLSHFFSIEFDKHKRKQKERFLLLLDKNNNENDNTMMDFLSFKQGIISENISFDNSLYELAEDEVLFNILSRLTSKELEVLHLLIIKDLKQVEVAEYFGDTPQNIAKIKKKAITKIRKEYKKRGDEKDDR